jgi:hypothetical protein
MCGVVDQDARSQRVFRTPTHEPGEERAGIQNAIGNVRPIGAPEHSFGRRLDECARHFVRVLPIGIAGKAVGAGQLDPNLPRFRRLDQLAEISVVSYSFIRQVIRLGRNRRALVM